MTNRRESRLARRRRRVLRALRRQRRDVESLIEIHGQMRIVSRRLGRPDLPDKHGLVAMLADLDQMIAEVEDVEA